MINLLEKYDVIVVGAGVAGLNCALNVAGDKSVLVVCKESPEKSDSYLAQGGICMLKGESDFDGYFQDTMRAGHFENNKDTVECMIRNSPEIISDLVALGVDFARESDGSLAFTREGGHSTPRICYHEDTTGKEITTHLMAEVRRRKNITVIPCFAVLDLIVDENECFGVIAKDFKTGKTHTVYADYTVLATGGIGGVFENSTNFRLLTGDALAICLNLGIAVDNVSYIQVHPTTLYSKRKGRRFLISESVRGEGAVLLDKNFNRFTDELKPRDVVTKAILKQMEKDGTDFVWLDMRPIDKDELKTHFPGIVEHCKQEGYDVFSECIPIVPSQHYFMGGIRSDLQGKTTKPRLYAVGETCCNGVHGKNRLASNSLLESLLFAKRAGQDINANYKKIDLNKAKAVRSTMDDSKYDDAVALLKQYKQQVINEIAKDKERKR